MDSDRQRRRGAVCAMAAILSLSLPFLLRPDGAAHGSMMQFAGRFHPLVVHLPVGLLLLLPVLEIAGRRRSDLRTAAAFVLPLAAGLAVVAGVLGTLLARGGGFTLAAVGWHLGFATVLALAALAAVVLRPRWAAGSGGSAYPLLLGAMVMLTLLTAHQGGALTYGRGYLTEFAPRLTRLFGSPRTEVPVNPAGVYAQQVQPLLNAKCISCHGATKHQGGLRMHSYGWLMDGGSSGDVVSAGHPEHSMILQRITLPPADKHFMPKDAQPLKPAEIDLLRAWIRDGASPDAATLHSEAGHE